MWRIWSQSVKHLSFLATIQNGVAAKWSEMWNWWWEGKNQISCHQNTRPKKYWTQKMRPARYKSANIWFFFHLSPSSVKIWRKHRGKEERGKGTEGRQMREDGWNHRYTRERVCFEFIFACLVGKNPKPPSPWAPWLKRKGERENKNITPLPIPEKKKQTNKQTKNTIKNKNENENKK